MAIVFDDDVTPLDAAHMNLLEQTALKDQPDGYLGLDADRSIALDATQEILWPLGGVLGQLAGGGVQLTGRVRAVDQIESATYVQGATGLILWAAGEASPRIQVMPDVVTAGTPGFLLGGGAAGGDTNLYRSAAGTLKTDGILRAVLGLRSDARVYAETGTGLEVYIGRDAAGTSPTVVWGGDTNLYRGGALTLKTDGQLLAVSRIIAYYNTTGQATIGGVGPSSQAGIVLGSGNDTNLYRSAVGRLSTDGELFIAKSVVVDATNVGGKLYFGSATDTDLYRSAANTLKTDGKIIAANDIGGLSDVYARQGVSSQVVLAPVSGNAGILFGSSFDTNLFRTGADTLKTDDQLIVGGQLFMRTTAGFGAAAIWFGTSDDAVLYRSGAGALKTDGLFRAEGDPGVANDTALTIFVSGVGARVVKVGAADSGGVGFRMLRVAN